MPVIKSASSVVREKQTRDDKITPESTIMKAYF